MKRTERAAPSPTATPAGQRWWGVLAACAMGAVAFAIAFPPIGLWPAILITPLALAWAAREARSTFVVLAVTFLTQFFVWMWLQQWVRHVTDIGYPALCAALACYTLLFMWIARRWFRSPLANRVPASIALAVLWTAVEVFRGEVAFDGYPWYLLAHPAVDAPLVPQVADLFGAYAVTFMIALIAGALIDLFDRRGATIQQRMGSVVVTTLVVGLAGVYGFLRTRDVEISEGPRVLAIQTNLPQDNKIGWPLDRQLLDLASFIQQTRQAFAEAQLDGPVDLVIWPETMLPGRGLEPDALDVLAQARFRLPDRVVQADFAAVAIGELQAQLGVPILLGSPSYLGFRLNNEGFGEWDAHHNSAYLVVGDLPYQRYDKVFLTPFGETMPYISEWPWLESQFLSFGARGMSFELDAGEEIRLIEVPAREPDRESITLATPICFEDTVSSVVRDMVWDGGTKRVDLIVNLSNDGWFGDFDAGRTQHLQIARYRAIENRLFLVRAANTGRTVAIDSHGNLVAEAGAGRSSFTREAGSLVVRTRLDTRGTLFGRIGNLFGYVTLLLTFGWLVTSLIAGRRGKKGTT